MSLNFYKFKNKLSETENINVCFKNESFLMKVLSFCLFFNKSFATNYVTTIGSTVYYPSKEFVEHHQRDCITSLAHEFVHIMDNKKYKIFFSLFYLFPQVLFLFSLFAIFAIINFNFIWFLLFLIFILPIPSYSRMKFEVKGYKMSLYMQMLYLRHLKCSEEFIAKNIDKNITIINDIYFKGLPYYFMWPFGVEKKLKNFSIEMLNGVISDSDELYAKVKEAFEFSKK